MRVAIAAGGTGGHIYPALAVARSLRARPAAPELAWIGGRRGLEAELVPPSGIPLRRLLAALAAQRRPRRPPRAGPAAPGRIGAAGRSGSCAAAGPTRSSRPAATWPSRSWSPRACCGSRSCSGRATWSPAGASGRRPASPAAVAVTDARTCAALAARRCYETGTPIRDPRSIDHEAARERPRHPGRGAAPARLRRLAGRPPLQRGGRRGAARARRALHRPARDRRRRLRRRPRGPRGAPGGAARALPAGPVPGRRDDGRAGRGRPRRGPRRLVDAGRVRRLRPCRSSASRTRTRRGHQRANAEAYAATGAARLVEDADFDAAALLEASRLLEDPAAHLGDERGRPGGRAAGGRRRGRGARRRPRAERRPWPAPAEIAALAAGAEGAADASAPAGRAFDADRGRHRDPAPHRRQDVARRAARPLHDDARRRAGRPLRGRRTTCSSCAALVKLARARAHPVHAARAGQRRRDLRRRRPRLLVHVRAEGHEIVDGRLVAEAGLPMAKAATVTAAAGLSGLEFGLAIPGNVGGAVWANAGAHASDVAAVLESALVLQADGSEARLDAAGLGLALPRQPPQAPGARRARGGRAGGDVPAGAGGAGRHPRAPRRDPALAAGAPAARHPERRQRLPQPGRRPLGRRPHRRPAGSRATGSAAPSCRRGTPTGSSTTRAGPPPTCAASASACGPRWSARRASGWRFEVVFLGDWSGWVEEAA